MKNTALVVAYDPLGGDSLMSLPAICGLAEKYDHLYVEMANAGVWEIADFPPNVSWAWGCGFQPNRHFLGMAAAIGYGFTSDMLHPTQSLMRFVGLDVPPEPVRPRIKPYSGGGPVPEFDVVIAPFTTAAERTLTVAQTWDLRTRLGDHTVAVLGGGTNPDVPFVQCYYNQPFAWGAELLRKAKVVVAIDSFPGRLAHAAGVKHHIVLDTGATPPQTQTYPGAIIMRVLSLGLEAVAERVLSLL